MANRPPLRLDNYFLWFKTRLPMVWTGARVVFKDPGTYSPRDMLIRRYSSDTDSHAVRSMAACNPDLRIQVCRLGSNPLRGIGLPSVLGHCMRVEALPILGHEDLTSPQPSS